jgi:hypothetical protein
MLVLVSGVIATGKSLIARKIIDSEYSFVIEDYSLDLSRYGLPGAIKDAEGNLTTIGELIASGVFEDGTDEVANLYALEYDFQQYELRTRLKHQYMSASADAINSRAETIPSYADYTITVPWKDLDNNYTSTNAVSIEEIVSDYNASSIRPYVINGVFGQEFINTIKEEVGSENVVVYNIIRHPSVVYALTSSERADADIGPHEEERLYNSLLQSVILKNDPNVITVKFEDMVANQEFMYRGNNVGVYSGWNDDNGLITTFERNRIISSITVDATDVSNFNTKIQTLNLSDLEHGVTETDTNNSEGVTAEAGTWDIFTELGYEPKTLAEITAS